MGWVATSEMQAAAVGRDLLAAGGSACDAAVGMAAALTVTEPTSNGLGGDLFALVHDGGEIGALAANGASPTALPVDEIRARGLPLRGWPTVTVPGQISGWAALHDRYGRLPFAALLRPAHALATEGFTLGPVTATAWARAARTLADVPSWRHTFLFDGSPPIAGQRVRLPGHAATLSILIEQGPEAMRGVLADAIVAFSEADGGWLSKADFARHAARWVPPLSVPYGDWRVWGMTAPTQGVCTLEALGILGGPDPGAPADVHRAIEAVKLSFADTYAIVADPARQRVPPEALLDPGHLARRRAVLGPTAGPSPARPGIEGGTVLICAVDDAGMSASVIQSNFHGFGSGLVVPGHGIALQNRGAGFVLQPGHPNVLAAGARPFHTILPGLIETADGVCPFGCMGGQMQPQGQVQMVTALARGATPQETVSAPRWRWLDSGEVALERGFSAESAADLHARGHRLLRNADPAQFGGAQLLWRAEREWTGGSDPRKDGGVLRSARAERGYST